jgi:16S rRNA processing protein RimM
VLSSRPAAKEILITLEGITDRNRSEALKGATVLVRRDDVEGPKDGEYFQADLIGLEAFDPEGNLLGLVEEIWETGPVPNLVIRKDGQEHIVPFVNDFVGDIDIDRRRVEVKLPQYED